ncbi:DUF4260 domain-containing protein [Tellurirhabdus bombi]|uniref:DUF4260 domain-containing protein n=1 Tax=Tellurirhabdus bombi TaxID=2907205 RepID=UPI001F2A6AF1|nr:DUF4260 domain-containing protein [Tellurirhabdus bombi]
MKNLLKIEELAQFTLSIAIFTQLPYAWWWFPALILVPDLSMLGYLVSTRLGAYLYNLIHHKATGIIVGSLGFFLQDPAWMLAGCILFAHSSMDRLFGYGLKYTDSFKHTHLDIIGK